MLLTSVHITDPGTRTTSFTYDSRGNRLTTTLPATAQANVIHTAYTPRGEIQARWGSQTYPEFRTYDYAGRLKTLHTWREDPPTGEPGAGQDDLENSDQTTWIYFPNTGLLHQKIYPDEKGTSYTNTDGGRLETRTWQRGIVTTYDYDDGGRLETTTYSDSTPNVAIELDALGRTKSISNGVAASVFTYNHPDSLTADTEEITIGGLTRVIEYGPLDLGRPTGWELVDEEEEETEHLVEYRYHEDHGRLHEIESPAGTFAYGYEPDSLHLLATVTKAAAGSDPALVATRAYESSRDTLESIKNKAGTIVRSSYDYSVVNEGVDSIGQRTGVRTTFDLGGAHTANPGDTEWDYDDLGQITSADHNTVGSLDRAYQYDAIGNRLHSEDGSAAIPADPGSGSTDYTPNALNQYQTITTHDEKEEPDTINPVFDLDGNMEEGPLPVSPGENWELVWDAENRLVEIRDASENIVVEYTYDAMSRRIARKIPQSPVVYYLYDGWNCIAEYDGGTLSVARTWGIDLSGTLQGAGGVGGLLAERHGTVSFYPTYDGNGNISEYLAANGSVAAHYEYDPFGNIVEESYDAGFDASSFTYKFSTKPLDLATGLYYYGYRYYEPLTGRWPSRDPIGERGGINLYGFVGNNPIITIDILGLEGYRKKILLIGVDQTPVGIESNASDWWNMFKGRAEKAGFQIIPYATNKDLRALDRLGGEIGALPLRVVFHWRGRMNSALL